MLARTRAHVVKVYNPGHKELINTSPFTIASSVICFIRGKN